MIGENHAFGYRPYGTTVDLARYTSDDDRRWQSKEFDGELEKYYFGARYFDPFFGLWMSPDPAGQFANPYSYGGDPLNFIDPTGMWAFGDGLVFGYDESHGWSLGVGVAAEFENSGVNASYTFNQDGSRSLGLNTNASVCVDGVCFNGGSGFNMNTYTGTSVSKSAGICFGSSSDACAGYELGQGYSWDRSGRFVGMTVYAEVYAAFAGGRSSYGYEQGFFGAEGRGMYAGIGGYGLHAEISQNGGTSWGVSGHLDLWNYDSQKGFDYFLKDFIDEIFNGDEYESAKENKNAIGKNLFGTIWCGPGPGGNGVVVTGGVDAGCRLHDFRYDAESERTGKEVAGVKGALTNINQRIVAADVKLVANSFGNMFILRQPIAGFSVGVVFSAISALKIPFMVMTDIFPRFHFDDIYLRRSSWEKSLQQ